MPWEISWRADPAARAIADRHYNRQNRASAQFVPPGRCLVLLCAGAVWVTSWPEAQYVQHAWAGAWVNSLFRREPDCVHRASDLITAAVAATRANWPIIPPEGIVTFVDESKVRHKRDPGRCYRRAGWKVLGRTKGGLLALGQAAVDMPMPAAAGDVQLALV